MGVFNIFNKEQELTFKVMASPFLWRMKAEELKFAAELIWTSADERLKLINQFAAGNIELDFKTLNPDTFSIFLSLIGFSTEALFKGTIIRDNPAFVSGGTLSRKLKTHDLILLSKLAKLSLSQHEEIFCKQAYNAMMVDSRYPIPSDVSEMRNSMEIGGHCKEVFNGLYERLYPTLEQMGLKKNN